MCDMLRLHRSSSCVLVAAAGAVGGAGVTGDDELFASTGFTVALCSPVVRAADAAAELDSGSLAFKLCRAISASFSTCPYLKMALT